MLKLIYVKDKQQNKIGKEQKINEKRTRGNKNRGRDIL